MKPRTPTFSKIGYGLAAFIAAIAIARIFRELPDPFPSEPWSQVALWAFYPFALAHGWSLVCAAWGGRESLSSWFGTQGLHWVPAESRRMGSSAVLLGALGVILGHAGAVPAGVSEILVALGLAGTGLRFSATLTALVLRGPAGERAAAATQHASAGGYVSDVERPIYEALRAMERNNAVREREVEVWPVMQHKRPEEERGARRMVIRQEDVARMSSLLNVAIRQRGRKIPVAPDRPDAGRFAFLRRDRYRVKKPASR